MLEDVNDPKVISLILIFGVLMIIFSLSGLYLSYDKKTDYKIYEVELSEQPNATTDYRTFNVSNLTEPNKKIFNEIKSEGKVNEIKRYQGKLPPSVTSDVNICEQCGTNNQTIYKFKTTDTGQYVTDFYIILISFLSMGIAGSVLIYIRKSLSVSISDDKSENKSN